MTKRKQHGTIKALNGVYWALKQIGTFFWLSAKYEYLGVKSIASSVSSVVRSNPTVQSTVKEAKKRHESASKEPATFVPWEPVSTLKGDFERFGDRIRTASSIVLVAGRRGSGKSVLGFRLLENIHAKTQRPCYVLGVKQGVLPVWIESVEKLEDVKNGGVVLVDEGAVAFGSRDSMSKKNKELGKLLAVARHKDLTLVLITQNTGMIDKNVLNLTDTILLKEGSLLQEKMERSVMKEIYRSASKAFSAIPANERQQHVYVFDNDFEGVCKVSLPSFWSSKVSKNQA
ncbi:hypothetical protein HY493_04365 [Candidatus Woesearchaeota archaeon]|nr:hypothetical protein [Candidatus Woesearchaeota archaeon]